MKIYRVLICFIVCIITTLNSSAQSSVSLSTGISKDINNSISFYHIPFSLIWKPFRDQKMPLILELDYALPLGKTISGEAFTLNSSLPESVRLNEKISPYIFTLALGFRIHLFTNKKNNSFYLNILPVGISGQNFKVSYKNYDNDNYEIINPDVSSKPGGFVMSAAPVYYFHKAKQDMMLMLHIQTPLLISKSDYPLSYKSAAPLQLTFGYNFYYNKRK
jgi:hypothetical protein